MNLPTEKQISTFLLRVQKDIETIDQNIKKTMEQLSELESRILLRNSEIEKFSASFAEALNRYSNSFGLSWPEFQQETVIDDLNKRNSLIRTIIKQEGTYENQAQQNISKLIAETNSQIELMKKSLSRTIRNTKTQKLNKEIERLTFYIEDLKQFNLTRSANLEVLRKFRSDFGFLDIRTNEKSKDESAKLRGLITELEARKMKLSDSILPQFIDQSCLDFLKLQRQEREQRKLEIAQAIEQERLRKNEEASLRKAMRDINARKKENRVEALKFRAEKSQQFLEKHSPTAIIKKFELAKTRVEKSELLLASSRDSCVRKVKQLQFGYQAHLLPHEIFRMDDVQIMNRLETQNWHQIPSLDNLVAKVNLKKRDLDIAQKELKEIKALVEKVEDANRVIKEFEKASREISRGKRKQGNPPRMEVENWNDAEELALQYIQWLGFHDARRTASGADEGKDVEGSKFVAQVKDMGTGATRPMLQQLFGVASAERKKAIFFSRSYARTALEWGDKHGIALFQFDRRGNVTPIGIAASSLLNREKS